MIAQSPKYPNVNMELIPALLEKSKTLLESKFTQHIKCGIDFIRMTLSHFKDEIISMKQFNQLSKVDLAREERVAKCDKTID